MFPFLVPKRSLYYINVRDNRGWLRFFFQYCSACTNGYLRIQNVDWNNFINIWWFRFPEFVDERVNVFDCTLKKKQRNGWAWNNLGTLIGHLKKLLKISIFLSGSNNQITWTFATLGAVTVMLPVEKILRVALGSRSLYVTPGWISGS